MRSLWARLGGLGSLRLREYVRLGGFLVKARPQPSEGALGVMCGELLRTWAWTWARANCPGSADLGLAVAGSPRSCATASSPGGW